MEADAATAAKTASIAAQIGGNDNAVKKAEGSMIQN
jgi:hypothetical protein